MITRIPLAAALLLVAACASPRRPAGWSDSIDHAFAQLTALQGEWVLAEGPAAAPAEGATLGAAGGTADRAPAGVGPVAAIYRTTGAGSAVVETLWPGTPDEMVTVYHRDGEDLVLTHYCSVGNQPHMRAFYISSGRVDFSFDGGTNIDSSRDMHMHGVSLEFVSAEEFFATWSGWTSGAPDPAHVARLHFVRRPG